MDEQRQTVALVPEQLPSWEAPQLVVAEVAAATLNNAPPGGDGNLAAS
jgi:hypothetical protein